MNDFTVKDLAKMLGVSKPTIQRAIKATSIKASREEGQTRYYDLETAAFISMKVKPSFDFLACVGDLEQAATADTGSATPPQKPPHESEQTETAETRTETPPQGESVEFMRAMLFTIQDQLIAKDKQIAAYQEQLAIKDRQIKDYSDRLAEAMELTKGQQYIAVADKMKELTTSQEDLKEENNIDNLNLDNQGFDGEQKQISKKFPFWKKFFRK